MMLNVFKYYLFSLQLYEAEDSSILKKKSMEGPFKREKEQFVTIVMAFQYNSFA